jgi:hypothetical protein
VGKAAQYGIAGRRGGTSWVAHLRPAASALRRVPLPARSAPHQEAWWLSTNPRMDARCWGSRGCGHDEG